MGGRELIEAVHKNDLRRVEALLASGVDVNEPWNHWRTALMQAVIDNNQAMVDFLIDKNARVNAFDMWSGSALIYAARSGFSPLVHTLIAHKADVNAAGSTGETALMGALDFGFTKTALLLVKSGVNINAQSRGLGRTALMQAIYNRKHAAVKFLLSHGADKTLRDRDGETALTYAQKNQDKKAIAFLTK